nr:unnamed protein product [Digitaria exilis]
MVLMEENGRWVVWILQARCVRSEHQCRRLLPPPQPCAVRTQAIKDGHGAVWRWRGYKEEKEGSGGTSRSGGGEGHCRSGGGGETAYGKVEERCQRGGEGRRRPGREAATSEVVRGTPNEVVSCRPEG